MRGLSGTPSGATISPRGEADNIYYERADSRHKAAPCRSEAPGAVSGLSHLKAPESLDEAARLAKASGIIEQIEKHEPPKTWYFAGFVD